jgi:hypothetical protein
MSEPLSASDLRAERARKQLPIYLLSAAVGMNPNRLGAILSERVPLTFDVALRIAHALTNFRPRVPGPRPARLAERTRS